MNLEELVALAKEVEAEDPIDWSMLNVDEDEAYRLMGLSVMQMYDDWKATGTPEVVMMATVLKLIVENFVLNLKLLERSRNGN